MASAHSTCVPAGARGGVLPEVGSGRPSWRARTIYALAGTGHSVTLEAIDITTHRSRTVARFARDTTRLAANSERVYLMDRTNRLRACDARSGNILWSSQLGPVQKNASDAQIAVTTGGIYVGLDDAQYGVRPEDGKVLWNHPIRSRKPVRPSSCRVP